MALNANNSSNSNNNNIIKRLEATALHDAAR